MDSIPLHIDIFALFIFLGTVQGIFLSYFFLSKNNRLIRANVFLGLLLIASSLISVDILLSYTNYMFQVVYLVDFTEPLNLVVGPLFYLYIKAKIDESKNKNFYFHFIPSVFYLLYSIPFYLQSIEAKYNAYIFQYHPRLNSISVPGGELEYPYWLSHHINELTILSISVYLTLSIIALYQAQKNLPKAQITKSVFSNLWTDIVFVAIILLTIIVVKSYFARGFGEFIFITMISLLIYTISIKVIRDSAFFKKPISEKKYAKSVLDEETKMKILAKITLMMDNKYYLNFSPSLSDLAKSIKYSPNYTSQVINEKLNLTFSELIAKYRIDEAKVMILDPGINKTIEEIAYSVGFNSKSTFHSAFKRITGQTPSQFKKSQNI